MAGTPMIHNNNKKNKTDDDLNIISLYESRIRLIEERHRKELQTLDLNYETKFLRQDIENHHRLAEAIQNKDEKLENCLQEQRNKLMEQFEMERNKENREEENNTTMLYQLQLKLQEQVQHLTQRHEEEKLSSEASIKCLKLKLAFRNIQKSQGCQVMDAFSKWRRTLEIGKIKDIYSNMRDFDLSISETKSKTTEEMDGQQECQNKEEVDFTKSLRSFPAFDDNNKSSGISTSRSRRGSRILLDDKDTLIKSLEANLEQYSHHLEEFTVAKSIYEKEKRDMQQLIVKLKRENTVLSSHVLTMIKANIEKGNVDFLSKRDSSSFSNQQQTKTTIETTKNKKNKLKQQQITHEVLGMNSISDSTEEYENLKTKSDASGTEENSYHSPINFNRTVLNTGAHKNEEDLPLKNDDDVFSVEETKELSGKDDNIEMKTSLKNHEVKKSNKINSKNQIKNEEKNCFNFASTGTLKDDAKNIDLKEDETEGENENDFNVNGRDPFEFDHVNSITDNLSSQNDNDIDSNGFSIENDWNNTMSSPFSPTDSFSSTNSSFSENSPYSVSSTETNSPEQSKLKENKIDEFSEGFDNDWSSFDNDYGMPSNDAFQDPFRITEDGPDFDSNGIKTSFSTDNNADSFQVSSNDPFSSDAFATFSTKPRQKGEQNNEINTFFGEDPFASESKF